VSYIIVAADAGDLLAFDLGVRGNVFHNLFVAVETRLFRDAAVTRFDADGVGKFAGGKGERMPEAVIGLHPVFAEEIVRRVAIVAGGDGTMAGFDPGIEMILHDVAIGAGFGIAGEVRATLGVDEGERTNSTGNTHRSSNDDPFDRARSHPLKGE
jgi:hypothetical protein